MELKQEYIKQAQLTTMQHVVVNNVCAQLDWLHEHEVKEVSMKLGWEPTSYYHSYDLAKLIVYYDILPIAKKLLQKYKKNVEIRMNPSEDKIPEILYMAQKFKPYDGDIDMLLLDLDSQLFSQIDAKAKSSGGTRYGYVTRYDNGYNIGEKYQMIFDKYPGKSLHDKMLKLCHWKKAWIKAIDLICGSAVNQANSLWSDDDDDDDTSSNNNITLIEELEQKQQVACQYNKDRRDALRKVESESMEQYAKDQQKIKKAEEAVKNVKQKEALQYDDHSLNHSNSYSTSSYSSSDTNSSSYSPRNDFWNLNSHEERKQWLDDNPVCSGCGSRSCTNAWCDQKY